MTQPIMTYLLEVEWGIAVGTGFDQDYSNITPDTLRVQTFHGRDFASQILGKAGPGRLTAILANNSGKYSPRNLSSPLSGLLTSGKNVRLSAGMLAPGKCAQFTPNAYLTTAYKVNDQTLDWDIVVWVNLDSLPTAGNAMGICSQWTGAGRTFNLEVDNTGGTIRFRFSTRNSANTTTFTATASTFGTPSTGMWYMLHAYYDSSSDEIGISVNNGAHNTTAGVGGLNTGAHANFEVGRQNSTSYFAGKMCALGVWESTNLRLTTAQLTWLYNAGVPRDVSELGISETDGQLLFFGPGVALFLLAYWQLNAVSAGIFPEDRGDSSLTTGAGSVTVVASGINTLEIVPLWTGRIESLKPTTLNTGEAYATLIALGYFHTFEAARRVQEPTEYLRYVRNTIGNIFALTLPMPTTYNIIRLCDIDTLGQEDFWYTFDETMLEALRKLEDTDAGAIFELPRPSTWPFLDGFIETTSNRTGYIRTPHVRAVYAYEDRNHRLLLDHATSQATFSDDPADSLHYVEIDYEDNIHDSLSDCRVDYQQYQLNGLQVLWTCPLVTTITLAPGETKVLTAVYPNAANSPAQGACVNAWTTPVMGTDITQTGVADSDISVSANVRSNEMDIHLTNNHPSQTATFTLIQARGTAVTFLAVLSFSSIGSDFGYSSVGGKTLTLKPFLHTPQDARSLGQYMVSKYGTQTPRVTMKFSALKDTAHMAQALGRSISDRITVKGDANAKLGINGDFFIESISHEIDMHSAGHMTTYELSDKSLSADWWVLGTSALGAGTRLSY